VVTHQAVSPILNGVTRLAVFDIICREGYSLAERPSALDEAKAATEAFLTSTSVDLLPVVKIDSDPVESAAPGALSRRLRNCYLAHAAAAERPP
jgi:D-alanine transaminase